MARSVERIHAEIKKHPQLAELASFILNVWFHVMQIYDGDSLLSEALEQSLRQMKQVLDQVSQKLSNNVQWIIDEYLQEIFNPATIHKTMVSTIMASVLSLMQGRIDKVTPLIQPLLNCLMIENPLHQNYKLIASHGLNALLNNSQVQWKAKTKIFEKIFSYINEAVIDAAFELENDGVYTHQLRSKYLGL